MMNDAICFGEKQEKQFWTGYEDFQFGCVELEMGVRDLNGETSEWLGYSHPEFRGCVLLEGMVDFGVWIESNQLEV